MSSTRVRSDQPSRPIAPATSRLLHPSGRPPCDRPRPVEALADIANGLSEVVGTDGAEPEWGTVRRRRILATPVYDAWVVELGPHTALEPHDHDGSIGVIGVVHGNLIEIGIDDVASARSTLRSLGRGDSTTVGIVDRHMLVNPSGTAVATIGVFSPPLGHDLHGDGGAPS